MNLRSSNNGFQSVELPNVLGALRLSRKATNILTKKREPDARSNLRLIRKISQSSARLLKYSESLSQNSSRHRQSRYKLSLSLLRSQLHRNHSLQLKSKLTLYLLLWYPSPLRHRITLWLQAAELTLQSMFHPSLTTHTSATMILPQSTTLLHQLFTARMLFPMNIPLPIITRSTKSL